jgi:hypothetical protein
MFRSLGAFLKLRKSTGSFVTSVRPSALMEQLDHNWTDCDEIWYLSFFSKIRRENSSFIKIWQE